MLSYTNDIPREDPADREARHAKVAARRLGPAVICHKGASAFAPGNTLEAYAAAMDYGADGCEIDPRRTADGVIVLFHDDTLEGLTDGLGCVRDLAYYELSRLRWRKSKIVNRKSTMPGIPTLASLLVLARQRAMLLHLDLKEPGLEDEITELLDEADMWDHIVSVNINNAQKLLANPKLKQLAYKAPGLYDDGSDVDIEATKAALEMPGDMIIVDDPRAAALVLNRPPYEPVPLPKGLAKRWPVSHAPQPTLDAVAEGIMARARAALAMAEAGRKTDEIVRQLQDQVRHRTLDRDWRYNGLDGAMAARALGELGAVESVPMLARILMSVSTDLSQIANPEYPDTPVSFYDWRIKREIVRAFGELVCDESRRALFDYVSLNESEARAIGVPEFAEATAAILNQQLSQEELQSLLRSPNRAVRGAAVLACLDHPTPDRRAALQSAAPWALALARAEGI